MARSTAREIRRTFHGSDPAPRPTRDRCTGRPIALGMGTRRPLGGGVRPRRHTDLPHQSDRTPTPTRQEVEGRRRPTNTSSRPPQPPPPNGRRVPIPGAMGRKIQQSRHDAVSQRTHRHDRHNRRRPKADGCPFREPESSSNGSQDPTISARRAARSAAVPPPAQSPYPAPSPSVSFFPSRLRAASSAGVRRLRSENISLIGTSENGRRSCSWLRR